MRFRNSQIIENTGIENSSTLPRTPISSGVVTRQALLALVKSSPVLSPSQASVSVASGRSMMTANRALSEFQRILVAAG